MICLLLTFIYPHDTTKNFPWEKSFSMEEETKATLNGYFRGLEELYFRDA